MTTKSVLVSRRHTGPLKTSKEKKKNLRNFLIKSAFNSSVLILVHAIQVWKLLLVGKIGYRANNNSLYCLSPNAVYFYVFCVFKIQLFMTVAKMAQ